MPKTHLIVIFLLVNAKISFAQNSFPANGNVLIGTTTDDLLNKLQVNGGLLLGSTNNNGDISLSSKDVTSLGDRMLNFSNTSMGVVRGGDLMINNFWGVAININKGLLGDNGSAQYSVVPNTTSFTINSFMSAQSLATLFIVKNNGNVGVGTITPQSKLAVNGTVTAKQMKVTQTGWPDYVFDSTYRLLNLNELNTFIKQYGHLPQIPTSEEVDDKGLNLGDMQKKQMQKIEELTLYLLQQNKMMEQQSRMIDALSKRVSQLEKGGRNKRLKQSSK